MAKKTIKLDETNVKVERKTVTITDSVGMLGLIRSSGLSLPAILALTIVNENFSAKYPMVYPGEVDCVYRSIIARPQGNGLFSALMSAKDTDEDARPWSYSAICRMLRVMHIKGYLSRQREGRYVAYGMTQEGIDFLVKLFGESMDKSAKKKAKQTKSK